MCRSYKPVFCSKICDTVAMSYYLLMSLHYIINDACSREYSYYRLCMHSYVLYTLHLFSVCVLSKVADTHRKLKIVFFLNDIGV